MVGLHVLGQDHPNKVQHDLFGHAVPLALALTSHDPVGSIKSDNALIRPRQLKLGATWLFWSYDGIATGIGIMVMLMVSSMAPLDLLCEDNQNEVKYYFYINNYFLLEWIMKTKSVAPNRTSIGIMWC